ncbi:MAG: hypothetical protein V1818_01110 [Candidatus Aenigmatarchaeota archaeon]
MENYSNRDAATSEQYDNTCINLAMEKACLRGDVIALVNGPDFGKRK